MHASSFRLTSRLACSVQYAVHLILQGMIDCVEDAQARKPEKKIACAWYVSVLCLARLENPVLHGPFMSRQHLRNKKTRSSLASRLSSDHVTQHAVSKSAYRRQKQRMREQLAGNQSGMQDLSDMVSNLASSFDQAKNTSVQELVSAQNATGTGNTMKSRRAILYVPR